MKFITLIEKIEIIEQPVEPLGKVFDWFNKVIDKFDSDKSKICTNERRKHFAKLEIYAYILLILLIGLISYGIIEIIKGDYPIFQKVLDGAICNDGWRSYSYGPGTCSWHKGVDHYLYKQVYIGYYYAKPELYFLFSFIIGVLIMILMYRYKYFQKLVLQILIYILRGLYFIIFCTLTFPLIFLRAGIQFVFVVPFFLYKIICRKK